MKIMPLDSPSFTVAQVARAAGVPVATLRSHLQRQHWRLDGEDVPADEPGKGHLVTMRRALQIGVAVELIRNGVDPKRAFRAAAGFSDFGGPKDRAPGELFDAGHTALVLSPGEEWPEVVRFGDDTPARTLFAPTGKEAGKSAVIVWLDKIVRDMEARLADD